MNKSFWLVIITTLILVTVTGMFFALCKKKADNEVVFWTLQMSDFTPYIQKVISNFEKENPDIKIKWIDVPFSEGEKRTLAAVLSDNPPDLVNLNPDFSATLAHKGALYEIPQNDMTQFNKEILDFLAYNGKIYSIPWYATSAVTIYNKSLLEQAGVPIPVDYSQTAQYAPIVKAKTSSYVMLPNITENDTMLKILNKYGVASSKLINSEKAVEVFDLFKYLYANDLIPKESVTMTLQESLEKYMSGNIMLITAGPNFLNMIKENAPATYSQTDVAPQITGALGQNDFSLMNFVIPLKAAHKKEALKFAIYLTNKENQLELAKLTNILAVNKYALQDDFYTKTNNGDLMSKARVISAKQLNKIQPVYKTQKGQKDINNIINAAVQEILLDKGSTKDVLDKAAKDWKSIEE